MRFIGILLALVAFCTLGACENMNGGSSPTTSESTGGAPAANSGVHVSGYAQGGGALGTR